MFTAFFSLGQVYGAELWLGGWFVCAIIYFLILLFNKANRQNVKNILFWFMVAELLTDLVWILLYYNNSEYVNYGIGAVYGLLLWPVALGTAGVIVSCQNKKHHKER